MADSFSKVLRFSCRLYGLLQMLLLANDVRRYALKIDDQCQCAR